jgi:hypothetical protein
MVSSRPGADYVAPGKKKRRTFHETLCDISYRLGGITPFRFFLRRLPRSQDADTPQTEGYRKDQPLTHELRIEPGRLNNILTDSACIHYDL